MYAFEQDFGNGISLRLEVSKIVFAGQSRFQTIQVLEHSYLGRLLVLDGVIQLTERDEFIYHEMMVHPAMASLAAPVDILIIGGGDGGVLRECLKYAIRTATVVELDADVVDICRKYLQRVSSGAFDDPRVSVVFRDGLEFLTQCERTYDVIIVDSTDLGPFSIANKLYSPAFYHQCRRCMNEESVLVSQNGVPFLNPTPLKAGLRALSLCFPSVRVMTASMPSYIGGPLAICLAAPKLPKPSTKLAAWHGDVAGIAMRHTDPSEASATPMLPVWLLDLIGRR